MRGNIQALLPQRLKPDSLEIWPPGSANRPPQTIGKLPEPK